ncbi:MAG: thioredoxin family protein [Chitinophagaceae bacterium]|nr:thioredoxin family protein [Chitinophagaceae bacterium]
MRTLCMAVVSSFLFVSAAWQTDFQKAKQSAEAEHKFILLNFSGSDWCGPCIRMHKEIFDSEVFTSYATNNLVLVNADFPRLKKHELSKDQQKKNDQLADVYNKEGIFPLTVLLTPEGKVIKKWEGFPQMSQEAFISQLKKGVDAGK